MPEPTEITDVPAEQVGENVQQLITTGAIIIGCTKQSDGSWTIRVS